MIVVDGGEVAVYVIFLFACHDVTVLQVELTPTEAALVRQLSRMSRAESGSDCQPRLSIVKVDRPDQRFDGDKVVSIHEQNPAPSAFGDRARRHSARGGDGRPGGRPGWLGGGEDRPR